VTDSIRVAIDLAAKQAQDEAKKLAKELDGAADAADDVESAGKRMAAAINRSADDMIDEIKDTGRAVQALDDALERAGGKSLDVDTRDVVAKLKAAGLTADDVTTDADELAAALKRIDDVKITAADAGFDDVDQALGHTTDNSRVASTAIGGIGNSISELPGVGTLGPVAESMGMLAENALEGEANIKGLVVAGGGLAALGLVMNVISRAMSSMAESKAFRKEQAQGFADAVSDVGAGIQAVNTALEDTDTLTGRTGGMGGFFEKTTDVTAELVELGYTQRDVNAAIAEGGAPLDQMIARLRDAESASRDEAAALGNAGEVNVHALEQANRYGAAVEVLTETRADYVKGVDEGRIREQYAADQTAKSAEALKEHTEAVEKQTDALEAQADAQDAAVDAVLSSIDSSLGYRNTSASTADQIARTNALLAEGTATTGELAQSARDAEGAALEQAAAAVRLAEDQAKANGAQLTAEDRTRIYRGELETLTGTLTGPALAAIEGHIAALGRIPRTISTTANFNTAIGSTRNAATNQRVGANAAGTEYWRGGPTWVGEDGAEIVDLPVGARVTPAWRAGDPAAAAPSIVNNLTTIVNMPAGARPDDVVEARRRYGQVQGTEF
jgi:hypothetical protein